MQPVCFNFQMFWKKCHGAGKEGCHMTTHVVADDVVVQYFRKECELRRRLMEGTLDPQSTLLGLQNLIEGKKAGL